MSRIEQSVVYPEVWYIKIGTTTIRTNETEIKELVRSFMATQTGKIMLENYVKRITKK